MSTQTPVPRQGRDLLAPEGGVSPDLNRSETADIPRLGPTIDSKPVQRIRTLRAQLLNLRLCPVGESLRLQATLKSRADRAFEVSADRLR
jgi:hypothetical protein